MSLGEMMTNSIKRQQIQEDKIRRLEAEVAELREALEPYKDICNYCGFPEYQHDENNEVDMMDELGRMLCSNPVYSAKSVLDKQG